PDPEEETPSGDKPAPEKEPDTKETADQSGTPVDRDSSQDPGSGNIGTNGDFFSEDNPGTAKKSGLRLTSLHFTVLGFALVAILGLTIFFLHHRTPQASPNPGMMPPQPTVNSTPASAYTPGNGTPAVSATIISTPGAGTSNQGTSLGNIGSTAKEVTPLNSSAQTLVPALQAAPVTTATDKMSPPYTSTPVPSPTVPETSASSVASTGASDDTPTPVPAAAAPAVEMTSPTPTANPDFWK
ncbi:MAG TPA: hypothetical protein VK859_09175, partial [bacterium]|nr:hypothetical protein [bacterium]